MASQRLANKTIVIIGGTSGMGLSAARACLEAGAVVIAVGRNAAKGRELSEHFGNRVRIVEGDATDPETAERAVDEGTRVTGALHGLYHVAGGSGRVFGDGPLDQISDEGWSRTLRLNLDSVFFSNRAATRQFLKQATGGTVLNMGSVLGFAPSPRFFSTHAYAASKAAIIGMTKASAAYYASANIRFNVVAPALVETPMATRAIQDPDIVDFVRRRQPLDGGRVGRPEDLDDAVLFFLSDESRFVTGQVLAVDGGWSVSDAAGTP